MKHPAHQSGVALITALLIVAMATIISANISSHLQLDIRRTSNMIASDQASLYTQAAEDWTRRILRTDRRDSKIDHLGEDWAIELPTLPVEGGSIKGKLTDLQGCFNLNSLLIEGAVEADAQARFDRLIAATELEINGQLSQAVIDWIDADLETTIPDGAEDSHYLNTDKPYATANAPIQSMSEMRLIKGFENNETYAAISPLVCAFGVSASINFNTAPLEVLLSLADDISSSDAQSIIDYRQDEPFNDITEFQDFNDLKKVIKQTSGLSVNSEYFLLETESVIGQARTVMYSIIKRDDKGETQVLFRSQGAY
jgi:general secretion pathway protein K